jgi:hypothetical protein
VDTHHKCGCNQLSLLGAHAQTTWLALSESFADPLLVLRNAWFLHVVGDIETILDAGIETSPGKIQTSSLLSVELAAEVSLLASRMAKLEEHPVPAHVLLPVAVSSVAYSAFGFAISAGGDMVVHMVVAELGQGHKAASPASFPHSHFLSARTHSLCFLDPFESVDG